MDRKIKNEVFVASAIGAMAGILLGYLLAGRFEWMTLPSVAVSCLTGMLVSALCCQPRQVGRASLAACRNLKRGFLPKKESAIYKAPRIAFNAVCNIIADNMEGIIVIGSMIVILAIFVAASRFTTGYLVMLIGGPSSWFFAIVINAIATVVVIAPLARICKEKRVFEKPSWYMPILARITRPLSRLCKWSFEEKIGFDPNSEMRPVDGVTILILAAITGPICVILLPFVVIGVVIDIVSTLVFALASTTRLASILGAATGTIVGLTVVPFGNLPAALAIGGLAGGLSGKFIYSLRRALTHKPANPASI